MNGSHFGKLNNFSKLCQDVFVPFASTSKVYEFLIECMESASSLELNSLFAFFTAVNCSCHSGGLRVLVDFDPVSLLHSLFQRLGSYCSKYRHLLSLVARNHMGSGYDIVSIPGLCAVCSFSIDQSLREAENWGGSRGVREVDRTP